MLNLRCKESDIAVTVDRSYVIETGGKVTACNLQHRWHWRQIYRLCHHQCWVSLLRKVTIIRYRL